MNPAWWLVPIAITMAAAGVQLYVQGRALVNPVERERQGRILLNAGWVWMGLGVLFFVAALVFAF
jgi:hypothetical protein